MFVTTSVAQALAFASKVATAMVIPQIASFISIFSARKAIQISFFSSISNCISLLFETRSWQPIRNIPKFHAKVSVKSWITIFLAIVLYAAIVISDLLVFQLAKRDTGWRYYPNSDIDLDFKLETVKAGNSFNVNAPLALVNDRESLSAFRNNSYIPAEFYQYSNMTPIRRVRTDENNSSYEVVYDTPFVNSTNNGLTAANFTCMCGQQVRELQVSFGTPLTYLSCDSDLVPQHDPFPSSIGANRERSFIAYQGDDGAHFTFLSSKQRDRQRLNETSIYPTAAFTYLNKTVQNFTLIGQQQNRTAVPLDIDRAFSYLSIWNLGTHLYDYGVIFTYYKIDKSIKFGKVPVYTYTYLIVEIIGIGTIRKQIDPYAIPGLFYFNYILYTAQNVVVPGKRINPQYLGIDANGAYGPKSAHIITDEPPEHVIIAMLESSQKPILVESVELVDAWPALLLIISAGVVSFLFYVLTIAHRVGSSSTVSFDPRVEIFHSALDNWKTNTADSLVIKMQETDLVMVDGYSPDVDGNKIGLVSRETTILPFDKDKIYK